MSHSRAYAKKKARFLTDQWLSLGFGDFSANVPATYLGVLLGDDS